MSSSLYSNLAALTGLLIWYGVFASLDRQDRARWLRPLLPLLLGAISFRALRMYLAVAHPLLAPPLESLAPNGSLLRFIIDVGLREEITKLLFALPCLLWFTSRSAQPTALLAGALVGVGFATVENRWFFSAHSQPTLLVGRIFSTTLLHAATTGLCSAALLRVWQGRAQAWARFAATLLIVAAAHGLYDWAPASGRTWLFMGGTSWLSQAVVIALAAGFLRQYRHQRPADAQGPAAAKWLLIGALFQYAMALQLTWLISSTTGAAWLCTQECALFLPVITCTAIFLAAVSPSLKEP